MKRITSRLLLEQSDIDTHTLTPAANKLQSRVRWRAAEWRRLSVCRRQADSHCVAAGRGRRSLTEFSLSLCVAAPHAKLRHWRLGKHWPEDRPQGKHDESVSQSVNFSRRKCWWWWWLAAAAAAFGSPEAATVNWTGLKLSHQTFG